MVGRSRSSGKLRLKTSFAVKRKWEPLYTGASVVTMNDGENILTCCGDSVKIVNLDTGDVKASISQDGDDVTSICCSPDNSMIVSAGKSLLLKQWTCEDFSVKCVRTWKAIHTAPILNMDFDGTSTLLATGSSDSTIKIWDMVNQYCTHNLRGSKGVITVVKFHPSQLQLFSSSDDYVIRLWNLMTSRCSCILNGHTSAVTSLVFSNQPSGSYMVSSARDSVLCVWNLAEIPAKNTTLEPVRSVPVYESLERIIIPSKSELEKLVTAVEKRAMYVLCAGTSGDIKLWNLTSGKCVYSQKNKDESEKQESQRPGIIEFMRLKNQERFATVTSDHNINILVLKQGFEEEKHIVGYFDEVLDVKFAGVGDSHVIVATNSPLIKFFDLESSACQLLSGHTDTVLCLEVFNDGVSFISASKDNSVRLWNIGEHSHIVNCIAVGKSHTHDVTALASSKLKNRIFATGSQDLTLKIWDIVSNSKGGDSDKYLKVKHTIKAHDSDINAVAISPNDALVASASRDKTAKLWNICDGELIGSFKGHKRAIWSCQFSPSDQVLCTSSADGTIKLWSLSDFNCLKTLEGHDCSILKIGFLSKGAQIVTSGSDGLIKIWNIKSNECVKTYDDHENKVWGLAVSKDGNFIISGAADSKMILWEDVTEKEENDEMEKRDGLVLKQQELSNLIQEKNYTKALLLAITLEQPSTALKVLQEMTRNDANEAIKSIITSLEHDHKNTMLKFCMSWNTNSRNCHMAQLVLNHILKATHPIDFLEFSNARAAVEALLPYSERHYQRMSRLLQNSTFLNYVWQTMKLQPEEDISEITKESTPEVTTPTVPVICHPLKNVKEVIPAMPKKRRKPDKVVEFAEDPCEEKVQNVLDTKNYNENKKTGVLPKKMRLRSAAKSS